MKEFLEIMFVIFAITLTVIGIEFLENWRSEMNAPTIQCDASILGISEGECKIAENQKYCVCQIK